MKFHDLSRGYLMDARHRYALEIAHMMAALMLDIQQSFGSDELARIQVAVNRALVVDDAVS